MARSIQSQLAVVQAEMQSRPKGLVQHVERVVTEALDLARRWDLDPERVELAAWGHDLFRSYPEVEQLQIAREAGLPLIPADLASPMVLHGPVAAAVLRERFGVADADVLAAIRDHTLGFSRMPLIARVILLADKIEARKRRRDPIMADIRRLARRDLDAAVLCWADWKWVEERTQGWPGHPGHWDARVTWVQEHHLDAALPVRVPDVDLGVAAGRRLVAFYCRPGPRRWKYRRMLIGSFA